MSNLFLFEFLVQKITFSSIKASKNNVKIEIKFGAAQGVIDKSIFEDNIDEHDDIETEEIIYQGGKLFLFPSQNMNLLMRMGDPITLNIYISDNEVGYAKIPWNDNFLDLLELSVTLDSVKPAKFENQIKLFNKENKTLGFMDIFMRLSFLGNTLETLYYMDTKADDFVFANPNSSKIFKCTKVGSKILPVSPIYNPVTESTVQEKEPSFGDLFDDFIFDEDDADQSNSVHSMATLVDRRHEVKFLDLRNMVEEAVQDIDLDAVQEVELTADKINRLMCNKEHCPAAGKFKDFGIGPLATGKGMGTVYGAVEPPVLYGMSQAFGNLEKYGPFGILESTKPTRVKSEVKIPVKESTSNCKLCANNSTSTVNTICSACESVYPPIKCNIKQTCCDPYTPLQNILNNNNKHQLNLECLNLPPLKLSGGTVLRLKGGGDDNYSDYTSKRNSYNKQKSNYNPLFECQATLKQFDNIIAQYKQAISPCHRAVCPQNENIMKDACQKTCVQPYEQENMDVLSCLNLSCPYMNNIYDGTYNSPTFGDKNEKISCHEVDCPFQDPHNLLVKQKFKDDDVVVGCMSESCPYKKYKASLVGEEKQMDKQFLPLGDLRYCGDANCEFAKDQPLPPIHWDCPDPLPKDNKCKNPNCPIKPVITERFPKSPCGNNNCPYTLPDPCELLTCPFRDRPCPYKGKGGEDECNDPDCVYNNNLPCCEKSSSDSIQEPLTTMPCCGNPNCPLTSPSGAKRNPEMDKCYNLKCPFSKVESPKLLTKNDCESILSETLPFECEKLKTCSENPDVCDNPGCPTNIPCGERKKTDVCSNPDCNYNRDDDCLDCQNPLCPRSDTFVEDSCTSPECPYNLSKRKREKLKRKLCKNPKCKFFKELHSIDEEVADDEEEYTCKPKCGEVKEKVKKVRTRGKFVYSIGDEYPGHQMGHKDCLLKRLLVPSYMGWMWNKPILGCKQRKGWIPGAIGKTIAQRIRDHRAKQGLGTLRLPIFSKSGQPTWDTNEVNVIPRPTLQIKKKEGSYYVTLNPLKDPKTLVPNEDPYMNCVPLTFKITKQINKEENCCCNEESSTDSDLDIEFTPPAGIIHPERFKTLFNVIHCDTQYKVEDFEKKKKDKKGKKGKKDKKGKGKGKKDKKKK